MYIVHTVHVIATVGVALGYPTVLCFRGPPLRLCRYNIFVVYDFRDHDLHFII